MSPSAPSVAAPVAYPKVGAVILRRNPARVWEALFIQPKGKGTKPGEPAKGLIRGTMQWWNPDSNQRGDVPRHENDSPVPEGAIVEAPIDAMYREVEEEAGGLVNLKKLVQHEEDIFHLGERAFKSADAGKNPYDIDWFVAVVDYEKSTKLNFDGIADIQGSDSKWAGWLSYADFSRLAEDPSKASPGYVPVVNESLKAAETLMRSRLTHSRRETAAPSR